ncbi:MAG: type VI secretion system baseplate subunit TssF [Alcaligenaceae bacterium]|nr:type VI secretion system baseplate subunit TssF [Alcaligenaceae bacterium]
MDSEFLEYYNRELNYIREAGREFAGQYPKIAGRLGMQGIEVSDPYVERLMEGFSFLTARIHMKMDAEFPQFTQSLLEVLHPHYVAPTPSMSVVQLTPDTKRGNLNQGFKFKRGTILRARLNDAKELRFTVGHQQELWPIQLEHAEISGVPVDLPLKRMGFNGRNQPQVMSSLRMRFNVLGGAKLDELSGFDKLSFFLNGQDIITHQLLELIMGHSIGVICHDDKRPMRWINRLDKSAVKHEGFESEQSLLPVDPRVFHGYRILHEYFAFPQRFLFFSINDLLKGLKLPGTLGEEEEIKSFEVTFLFDHSFYDLEANVSTENFQLNCVPIINLFPYKANRIPVSPNLHEYHVVPDRSKPMDYEVYSVDQVEAMREGQRGAQSFKEMFRALGANSDEHHGYFSVRREPRQMSDTAQRSGSRTSYLGSETYLSLSDPKNPPFDQDIEALVVGLSCTNRDLPLLLRAGDNIDFRFSEFIPTHSVQLLRDPSKPRPALARGAYAWRLLSHLNLNYSSMMDLDEEQGAAALRELLRIYADVADAGVAKQINGIRKVSIEAMHHRIPMPGPILYGRGVKIEVEVDELAFSGISPYLLGAVLEQFFARHVSINLMTELVLKTMQRGEIGRWKPRMGARPVI